MVVGKNTGSYNGVFSDHLEEHTSSIFRATAYISGGISIDWMENH
jgi:hypothetical protein